ncbi:MAG: hypothetical protein ACYTG5_22925, partial [Planctomycetota bacterium]
MIDQSQNAAGSGASMARMYLSLCLLLLAVSCINVEDKRLRQLLNEKGFGGRAEGNANVENYVAGRDLVGFAIRPEVYQQPGAESLFLLTTPQPVGLDGTILVPHVG